MMNRYYLLAIIALVLWVSNSLAAEKPNVVYIMADELGYFEPGFMGGKNIETPNIDNLAKNGMVFSNLFAGSSVCAPTRCCFLTGKHSGHTSVRSNGGGTPLREDEQTIASILKPLGYATGGFGKWGCGGRDSTGVPEIHGFDVFLGYYDQVHAHSYYPPYLIRNSEEVPLSGNNGNSNGTTYSQYVIHDAAMSFIRANGESRTPFFAYLPYTPPHGIFDIPDSDPAWPLYENKPWPEQAKRYAAMTTMLDRQVGEILALLKELKIDENTLVVFSGDNGGADYFATKDQPRGVHSANKHPTSGIEYRGHKGQLYEGGLRIPFVASWPGKIQPGTRSDLLGYFPDMLPTIAEITGAQVPGDVDGISLIPTLFGREGEQQRHEFLYWEIGGQTAIRQGEWRAVKPKPSAEWELYNVELDPSESKNVASTNPAIVDRLALLAEKAHSPAVEGTFSRTDRHQRDRRAKVGKHDDLSAPDPLSGRPKAKNASGKAPNVNQMPREGLLSSKAWKIVRASSENTSNGKLASNIIDGDPTTHWHSRFSSKRDLPPYEIVVDLAAEHEVKGFVCLARQDASFNGAIRDIQFSVSSSPDAFDTIVVSKSMDRSKEPQVVNCEPTRGRYVLIRVLSDHGGGEIASLAELGVIGN